MAVKLSVEGQESRMPKILQLNQGRSAAYSPAFSVMGECRGKQGAEAVEPGSQEAQAEKERGRKAIGGQGIDAENLRICDGIPRPLIHSPPRRKERVKKSENLSFRDARRAEGASRRSHRCLSSPDGVAPRGLVRVEVRESRATRRPASPISPTAPRRAGRPRGCRGSALPCAWTCRGEQDATTCRERKPP